MKSLFIAGNWKSNKTTSEAMSWLRNFQLPISNDQLKNTAIVLCVPFTLLYLLKQEIARLKLPIQLGAQDVSPYDAGAYTGEVNAAQIKEFADWVIIGHSERRKNLKETDDMLAQKVVQAQNVGLKIIYCVQDEHTQIPNGIDVVAYEPVWAIGTSKTDTPENANHVIETIQSTSHISSIIYGGSVTADNVVSFVSQRAIGGVLPGGASLDGIKFSALIANASHATGVINAN